MKERASHQERERDGKRGSMTEWIEIDAYIEREREREREGGRYRERKERSNEKGDRGTYIQKERSKETQRERHRERHTQKQREGGIEIHTYTFIFALKYFIPPDPFEDVIVRVLFALYPMTGINPYTITVCYARDVLKTGSS